MKILYIAVIACILAMSSCLKDEGNYNYKEINRISLADIASGQVIVALINEKLEIVPEISQSLENGEDNLSYCWYVRGKKNTEGEKADTIGKERNLSYFLRLAPGEYVLTFRVIDDKTGVFTETDAGLEVQHAYSEGLIVLSEDGGNANVSFINFGLDKEFKDIYQSVNGSLLGTDPIKIYYTRYNNILVLCRDANGGVFLDPESFMRKEYYKDAFFNTPSVVAPESYVVYNGMYFQERYDDFILNNGRLHKRTAASVSMGELKFYGETGGDYELYERAIADGFYNYFYDNKSLGWVKIDSYNNIVPLENVSMVAGLDLANYGMKLIHMDILGGYTRGIYAGCVFKDETEDKYYAVELEEVNGRIWKYVKNEISSDNGIAGATVFANSYADRYIYYVSGSKVFCINSSDGNIMEVADFPGYTIDNMVFDGKRDYSGVDHRSLYVALSSGADKGTIVVMEGSADGTLSEQKRYQDFTGRIVDMKVK